MGLKERLQADLKEALRARDEPRKRVIRLALAAVADAEIERAMQSDEAKSTDGDVFAVLQKQAKQRRETIAELREVDRPDLLSVETKELAILEEYLPEQLPRHKVVQEARRVIGESGASGMNDMGTVMRRLMSEFRGQVDGRVVNEVVRELLTSQ
jgi:uncharacterized protein YqeY